MVYTLEDVKIKIEKKSNNMCVFDGVREID